MTAVAGETLRLKCPVAGYPIEEIKWERANRELPDDLRQKVLPDGTLMINSVQKKGDAGVYTCWARNKQGHSARRSGDVAVIGKASLLVSYDNELPQVDYFEDVDLTMGAATRRKNDPRELGRRTKGLSHRIIDRKTKSKYEVMRS